MLGPLSSAILRGGAYVGVDVIEEFVKIIDAAEEAGASIAHVRILRLRHAQHILEVKKSQKSVPDYIHHTK